MTKLNWKDIKGAELVPSGRYEAVFTKYEKKRARNNESDNMNCEFTIDDDDNSEFNKRKLYKSFNMKDTAVWALKAFVMVVADMTEEDLDEDEREVEEILEDRLGTHVALEISEGEYKGRPVNSVDQIRSLDDDEYR